MQSNVTTVEAPSPETYQARKKAFKAARPQAHGHIPVTKNSPKWFPAAFEGNNRKETNERGVNPRMMNVQRFSKRGKIRVMGNLIESSPKVYHPR